MGGTITHSECLQRQQSSVLNDFLNNTEPKVTQIG